MIRKLITFSLLAGGAVLLWFISQQYTFEEITKLYHSLVSVTASYLFFKIFLEESIFNKVKDSRTRYSLTKTTHILFILVSFIVVLRIWIIDPQALLVAYGLVAAGIAIALQDIFKNFAGLIAILLTGIYKVGDRIEIDGKHGDVIDIGIFYTSLLEIKGWVSGDQATGRITIVPNGRMLSNEIYNYTKDHKFIWDEISLPVTYDSNWRKAVELIKSVIKEKTIKAEKLAEKDISKLRKKYYVQDKNTEPNVFITLTDNWIMLRSRYVSEVQNRRITQNEISTDILEKLEKEKDITIASENIIITNTSDKR